MPHLESFVLISGVALLMAAIAHAASADTPSKSLVKPAQPVATKSAWKSLRGRVRGVTQQNHFLQYIRGTGAPEYDLATYAGQP